MYIHLNFRECFKSPVGGSGTEARYYILTCVCVCVLAVQSVEESAGAASDGAAAACNGWGAVSGRVL